MRMLILAAVAVLAVAGAAQGKTWDSPSPNIYAPAKHCRDAHGKVEKCPTPYARPSSAKRGVG